MYCVSLYPSLVSRLLFVATRETCAVGFTNATRPTLLSNTHIYPIVRLLAPFRVPADCSGHTVPTKQPKKPVHPTKSEPEGLYVTPRHPASCPPPIRQRCLGTMRQPWRSATSVRQLWRSSTSPRQLWRIVRRLQPHGRSLHCADVL